MRHDWAIPWIFALLFLGLVGAIEIGYLRLTFLLLFGVAILLSGIWHNRWLLASRRNRLTLAVMFAVSLLVAILPEVLGSLSQLQDRAGVASSLYPAAQAVSVVILGWSFLLWLPLQQGEPTAPEEIRVKRESRFVLGLSAATFVAAAVIHFAIRDRYAKVVDEVLYLLQSQFLSEPGFVRHIEPALRPFFVFQQACFVDDRFYSQYPPGWPALLAAFSSVGLQWWTNVVLATVAVFLVYLLGKRLHSGFAGLVAALLLATNYLFLYISATYFPHLMTLVLAVAAALLLLRVEARVPGSNALPVLLAGFLLGLVIATRPLTGVGLAVSLTLWIAVRGDARVRDLARTVTVVLAGALIPIAALLYYNNVTNGSPFVFGYEVANGELHDLGFGTRGIVTYDQTGHATSVDYPFTPLTALEHFSERSRDAALTLLPGAFLIPLIFLGLARRYSFHWRSIAVFSVVPALYFFFFFSVIRFYTELLPFIFVGVATLIAHFWRSNAALGRSLLIFLIAGNLVLMGFRVRAEHALVHDLYLPYFSAVETIKETNEEVLVLVGPRFEPPRRNDDLFIVLSQFNGGDFPERIVVARDLGHESGPLLERFPRHVPVRIHGGLRPDASGRPQVQVEFVSPVRGNPPERSRR
jgi:hypothetical protein